MRKLLHKLILPSLMVIPTGSAYAQTLSQVVPSTSPGHNVFQYTGADNPFLYEGSPSRTWSVAGPMQIQVAVGGGFAKTLFPGDGQGGLGSAYSMNAAKPAFVWVGSAANPGPPTVTGQITVREFYKRNAYTNTVAWDPEPISSMWIDARFQRSSPLQELFNILPTPETMGALNNNPGYFIPNPLGASVVESEGVTTDPDHIYVPESAFLSSTAAWTPFYPHGVNPAGLAITGWTKTGTYSYKAIVSGNWTNETYLAAVIDHMASYNGIADVYIHSRVKLRAVITHIGGVSTGVTVPTSP
ncbi:MAG: hypothetical protein MH204_10630 [Fimbriimonadaceae bacterium]|nr:hypothetical protein [Fimbriimonadaceae bacterium]